LLYIRLSSSHDALERKVAERTKHLEILNTVARDMNYITDVRQLFSLLFSHLGSLIKFDIAAGIILGLDKLSVFTSTSCRVEPFEEKKFNNAFLDTVWKLSSEADIFRVRKFTHIRLPEYRPDRRLNGIASIYNAPVYFESRLIAYLQFGAEREQAFDSETTRIIDIVLSQTAVMMQRLMELLSSERRRLEEVVRSLPEGVLVLDGDKNLLMKNPEAERILRILFTDSVPETMNSFGGLHVDEITSPKDNPVGHIVEIRDKGETFLHVTVVALENGSETGGSLIVLKDITAERRNARQAELQERLAAMGQLASGLAHDVNNILTGIIGYSEYLQMQKNLPSKMTIYLKKIVEQSKRAGSLIQQVLDFSRMNAAGKNPMNLVSFCKEMVKLFERIIPENIRISFTSSSKVCNVNSNPAQLQQLLTNIVVNARDAMPDGGLVTIRLRDIKITEGDDPPIYGMTPGDWFVLTIADTGTGIPADIIDKVMEPFFTTKEIGKGVGLGLSQVYGLVKDHGGHLEIRSSENQGTEVILYFPACADDSPGVTPETELHLETTGNHQELLLVEDNAEIMKILQRNLQEAGYVVFTAENGKDALDIYKKSADTIQAVITDAVMPGMGGIELIREVRKINTAAKIILMTGHGVEHVQELEEFIPSFPVLTKPFEFATLIQTINNVQ